VNAELAQMARIARAAAVEVMKVYARPFEVEFKAPQDPVTEADRIANALICEELARTFPGVPVVAEESDPRTFAHFRDFDRVFFVDPVDGTREFVDRNGEFAVMIGLLEGAHALASVIDAPARGDIFTAWVGQGAFREREGKREPISVSQVTRVDEGRLVGSRSHRSPSLERVLTQLAPREVRVLGSAGLKGTLVAAGEVEAYVAPGYAGQRWDACAADALVTAAGGLLTNTHGERIDYRAESLRNDRGLLASNGHVHEALLRAFAEHRSN
jgi:3'(2'), 5'-bisphosphate nucleotidase